MKVVVTGAAGGIGTAAVAALRDRGAQVAGIDLLGEGDLVAGDVTDRDSIAAAVETCAERLGGIDVLVNNAGIGIPGDAGDFPDAAAHAVMGVNFFGAWNATAAALPHLLESRGHVVNVASGLAIVDIPFAVAYSASKRALAAYSAALRVEYAGRIGVTTVYPGYIRTSIHDAAAASGASLEGLVRADTIEGAAAAVVRACTKRPRTITTSRMSTVELWAARRFPNLTARTIEGRVKRWKKDRAAPGFVRYPDGTWGQGLVTPNEAPPSATDERHGRPGTDLRSRR